MVLRAGFAAKVTRFRIRGSLFKRSPAINGSSGLRAVPADKAAMLSALALTGLHHRSTTAKQLVGALSPLLPDGLLDTNRWISKARPDNSLGPSWPPLRLSPLAETQYQISYAKAQSTGRICQRLREDQLCMPETEAWRPVSLPSFAPIVIPSAENPNCLNCHSANIFFSLDFELVCRSIGIDCQDAATSEAIDACQREYGGSLLLHCDDMLASKLLNKVLCVRRKVVPETRSSLPDIETVR